MTTKKHVTDDEVTEALKRHHAALSFKTLKRWQRKVSRRPR